MRLEQAMYCMEVARCKSMSQAAKKLFISQSTLSTAIQNLEEELGFQVFRRSAQGVAITDQGSEMLEKCRMIVDTVEEIKRIGSKAERMEYRLSMAVVPAVSGTITTELLKRLNAEYQRVELQVLERRPEKILGMLIQGKADVVIGSYTNCNRGQILDEAVKNNIVIEPIYDDQMYAFVCRNHPLARKESVWLNDLQEESQALFNDFVFMEPHNGMKREEQEKGRYFFTEQMSIKQVVAEGLAYALLPYSMAYRDLYVSAGLIRVVPIADVDAKVTMYIGYKDTGKKDARTEKIVEMMHEIYDTIYEDMVHNRKQEVRTGENNQKLVY